MLSVKNYCYKSWNEKYPDNNVDLNNLLDNIHNSWKEFFDKYKNSDLLSKIEKVFERNLRDGKIIYPYPDLVFNAFNITPLHKLKVLIIGQDPYFNNEKHNKKIIPQAMGLSFSVPNGVNIPSSLKNIYNNLLKYKHITYYPNNGNLASWACQGCLLLNATLTVKHGCKNSHEKVWNLFTNELIKYISNNCDNIIFVLWGGFALKKLELIETDRHKVIISSHPSGLSCNKPLRNYKAFNNQDHFGLINKYLKKMNKETIIWGN